MIGWPPIPNIGTFPDGGWGDVLITPGGEDGVCGIPVVEAGGWG